MASREARHDAAFARAKRSCSACRYFSDQVARTNSKGDIEAKCLNHHSRALGLWRAEIDECRQFEAGDSIDLPQEAA